MMVWNTLFIALTLLTSTGFVVTPKNVFRKVFVSRRSLHPNQPGEWAFRPSLSYPCAIEHDG